MSIPTYDSEINEQVAHYERLQLENKFPQPLALPSQLDRIPAIRLLSLTSWWKERQPHDWTNRLESLVISAWSAQQRVTFVLYGEKKGIELYAACGASNTTTKILRAALPGSNLASTPVLDLGTHLAARLSHTALISGIPNRPPDDALIMGYVDLLVRAMRNTKWALIVDAQPLTRDAVLHSREEVLERLGFFSSIARRSIQETEQESTQRTSSTNVGTTRMVSGELINWRAQNLTDLLELERKRLERALTQGYWEVLISVAASTSDDLVQLAGLIAGLVSGEHSRPIPIRTHFAKRGGRDTDEFKTLLTSVELAAWMPIPQDEVPGLSVLDYVTFDTDFPSKSGQVDIGQILNDSLPSGHSFGLPLNDLTKHGIIAGVTGSGKTTTVMALLESVYQASVPFCVIEPAKTEYRALFGKVFPNLTIYTLGDETTAPFRLNPFEFETDEMAGSSSILSHIDILKAVFNAAFILYAPMPYVLETALHEIYEDKGWNLATGENMRLPTSAWKERHRYPIFPTLTDLYRKIDQVVIRLGYDERIERDVIAGLKARIGALRLGAKGLMLDTARGLPSRDLFSVPVILELEKIGSDDEKTFLIGLLLTRLYEYRRLQVANGKLPDGLQHMLVIEEAHRLLANLSAQVSTESANPRSQAVETFVNMLSEIRAYQQGVLIVEQIPSKLTPDVIKNTNLKIIHRLLATDDRTALGNTMNMDEAQLRALVTLAPGIAAASAEGADHPYLIKVDDLRASKGLKNLTDATLRAHAQTYLDLSHTLQIADFASYGARPTAFGTVEALPYQYAGGLMEREGQVLWARLLMIARFVPAKLPEVVDEFAQVVVTSFGHLPHAAQEQTLHFFLLRGAAEVLNERAAENGWSYVDADTLRQALTAILIRVFPARSAAAVTKALATFDSEYSRLMTRKRGPYPGCVHCRVHCQHRSEALRLLTPTLIADAKSAYLDASHTTRNERFEGLASALREMVETWLGGTTSVVDAAAFCAGLICGDRFGYDRFEQAQFAASLAAELHP